jgi:hypothetical protein
MKQRAVFEKFTLHLSTEVQHTITSIINLDRYRLNYTVISDITRTVAVIANDRDSGSVRSATETG